MASAARAVVCAAAFPGGASRRRAARRVALRASGAREDPECNTEECAPEKEVGKVSGEWLAGEKTAVVGTFPPKKKKSWTGYVEKDTAGQTNIYSVEPVVYVAESAISSGSAGKSSDGSENTLAVIGGIAFVVVATAVEILVQVRKNAPPPAVTVQYSGPPLSYYISRFKPAVVAPSAVIVEESAPALVDEELAPADVAAAPADEAAAVEATASANMEPVLSVEAAPSTATEEPAVTPTSEISDSS